MRTHSWRRLAAASIALAVSLAAFPGTSPAQSPDAALADIEATLGSVPTFFRLFPPEALPGAWGTMKALQLSSDTALPPKYKELIGLAVAAQVPCDYCAYFHTEAARIAGASDAEIREAVAVASFGRFLSTFLNGSDQDYARYRREIGQLVQNAQAGPARAGTYRGAPREIRNRNAALRDIEATFGFVPSFLEQIPPNALAPVWHEFRALAVATDSEIPPKYKDLIGVAVAAQIPSRYCVYANRAFAEAHGASDQEIQEAIGLAAVTRHWSTFLNGLQVDGDRFRHEVDIVMNHVEQAVAKRPGPPRR